MLATGTALALVLAGGLTTGWWLVRDTTPSDRADRVAAPGCVPAEGSVFLPIDTTHELRTQVGAILARSPEVDSSVYESREQAWQRFKEQFRDAPDLVDATKLENLPESWKFKLRCATDYPAVKERLHTLHGVDVVCSCDPGVPNKPTVPSDTTSDGPPVSPTPAR